MASDIKYSLIVKKVLDKAVATPGRNTSSDNNITVGGEGSTSGRYFNGFIAEVKIYGSALSEQDIKNLYTLKMAVDHKHQLLLRSAQESISKRETSNLILNGFGEYEDNTNFTFLDYIPNTDLPGVKGVFQRTGDLATIYFSNLIPINSSDQYYLEHWSRVVTGETGVRYYSTVMCYDSNKRGIVNPNFNIINSNCNTTLAQPLKPGDTVAYIANGSAWASLNPSVSPRVYLAMATDPAYPNYSYMPDYARVSSISGTTLTLAEAWSGEEVPTGMPVTATKDGSTYVYSPASNALLYSTWTRHSGHPVFRTGTKYVRIGLLANYSGATSSTSVQYGGFLMKNISGAQNLETTSLFQIDRNTLKVNEIYEVGRPIRYIRDSINGSTSNASNHWALIKAINRVGENIAIDKAIYGPTVVNPPTIRGLNVVLRDSISSSPYIEGSNYCIVDLGEITEIVSIGIWHYYADGRTYYDNKVEVSIDGENWDTVFDNTGKTGYRETSAGNQIILQNPYFNIDKDGGIRTREIKEVF